MNSRKKEQIVVRKVAGNPQGGGKRPSALICLRDFAESAKKKGGRSLNKLGSGEKRPKREL